MNSSSPVPGDILFSAGEIRTRVAELGREIDISYADAVRPPVLICVLTGALIFTADLARALTIAVEVDYLAVRSYGTGLHSSGHVELLADVSTDLGGRDVLVVEDIIDSGGTAAFLREHLAAGAPRSLRLVTLVDKRSRRERSVRVDWRGFEVGDEFVVGYGLDHAGRYRNLPDVHALRAS